MKNSASDLHRFRQLLLLGGILYPVWWFVFKYLVPGAHDDLTGRIFF